MSLYMIRIILVLWAAGWASQSVQAQSMLSPPSKKVADVLSLSSMQEQVAKASMHAQQWAGPSSGPRATAGATVAVISEDLHNGGILGVVKGITEAAKAIGWNVKVFNIGGTTAGRDVVFAAATALKPDGIILVGMDAKESQTRLEAFRSQNIAMVGWHVGPQAGVLADGPVAMNVSTDPLEVARITAMAAVVQAKGNAGVVIFTDSHFEIAKAKANAMANVIKACKGCSLLEVKDVAISQNAELMPATTRELLGKYGKRWTYALAINDIYFDYAASELTKGGFSNTSINMMSAGDGSPAAFLRIQAGTFQTATVAEPLNLHGWQLVDELNRLLAHQSVSGYLFPVHLVTTSNIAFDGGTQLQYDPDNGYRDVYRRIWQR